MTADLPNNSRDCVVIGAGPAGLTAAIYLARFNRQVLVFDAGKPRVQWSPWNRNYPGFPDGIAGSDLHAGMRRQAELLELEIHAEQVTGLSRGETGFRVETAARTVETRTVVLATGVTDIWPNVPDVLELAGKHIRVCPICDAHEVTGRRAGLIGSGAAAAREALYLRHFTQHVSLFTDGCDLIPPEDASLADRLEQEGIEVHRDSLERIEPAGEEGARLCLSGGCEVEVDLLFSALGVRVNNALARAVGAQIDDDGYIPTARSQETSVPGLYAVGDITCAINQVTVAVGQGATAATTIHNSLLDF